MNPPLRPAEDGEQVADLLREERDLIERLRGAYFLALRPILPLHYIWSDMDVNDLLILQDDPARRRQFYSPDVARRESTHRQHSVPV